MSLRKKLIRLAYEQPQLRGDILPLIKEGGDFTKEEWKAHKEKHPGAEAKDHNITDGKSEKKDDGDNLNAPKKNIFKDHSKLKSDLESFAEDNDIDLDFDDIMELEEEWEDALYDLEDKDEDKAEEFKKKMGEFFKSNEKQMKIQSKIETMSDDLENDDSSKGKFILSMLDNMGDSSDPTTHLKTLKDVLSYVKGGDWQRKNRKDKLNEDTIDQIRIFENETISKSRGKFHLSKEDQQKALEEYIGEIERIVGGETKSKGKKATLRSSLIRLAFEQPQLRDDILPLITKSAGEHYDRWGMWSKLLKRYDLIAEIERNPMPMYDTELKVFYSRHKQFHNVDTLMGDIYATIGYDRNGTEFTVHTGNKSSGYTVGDEKSALKDLVRYFK